MEGGMKGRKGGKGIMVGRMVNVTFVRITFIHTPYIPAGALGTMCSFNDYDGEPMGGNRLFLTEYLREKWGFKGSLMSYSPSDIILSFFGFISLFLSFLRLCGE
jgi:hypothetical protein